MPAALLLPCIQTWPSLLLCCGPPPCMRPPCPSPAPAPSPPALSCPRPKFLAVYAGLWVSSHFMRPIRLSLAIAAAPAFDSVLGAIMRRWAGAAGWRRARTTCRAHVCQEATGRHLCTCPPPLATHWQAPRVDLLPSVSSPETPCPCTPALLHTRRTGFNKVGAFAVMLLGIAASSIAFLVSLIWVSGGFPPSPPA